MFPGHLCHLCCIAAYSLAASAAPRAGLPPHRSARQIACQAIAPDGQVVPQQWLAHTTAPGTPDDRRRATCFDATQFPAQPRPGAAETDGSALRAAECYKHASHTELCRAGPRRLLPDHPAAAAVLTAGGGQRACTRKRSCTKRAALPFQRLPTSGRKHNVRLRVASATAPEQADSAAVGESAGPRISCGSEPDPSERRAGQQKWLVICPRQTALTTVRKKLRRNKTLHQRQL